MILWRFDLASVFVYWLGSQYEIKLNRQMNMLTAVYVCKYFGTYCKLGTIYVIKMKPT